MSPWRLFDAISMPPYIEGPHAGWQSSRILGLFAASGAALALFLFYERRRQKPLLDLRFFRNVPFSSAALLAVCAFASFAGFLFLNALYLQQVRGLSAFHTGLCTLPLAIAMMVCARLSGRLVARHGPRPSLNGDGRRRVLQETVAGLLRLKHKRRESRCYNDQEEYSSIRHHRNYI
jgi:peptidoglycan/LPS O-acetylase OafA/YrhL